MCARAGFEEKFGPILLAGKTETKTDLERLLSFLHSRRFADVRNQYFEPQGACIKLLKQRQEHGKNTCYSAPWSSDKQDLSLYSQLQLFMNTDIAAMYQFLPISM